MNVKDRIFNRMIEKVHHFDVYDVIFFFFSLIIQKAFQKFVGQPVSIFCSSRTVRFFHQFQVLEVNMHVFNIVFYFYSCKE